MTDLSPSSNAPFLSSCPFNLCDFSGSSYADIKISIKIKVKCEILACDFTGVETDCNIVCNFFSPRLKM